MGRTPLRARLLLGIIGLLLLTYPAAEVWRAATEPFSWDTFTPLGILATVWAATAGLFALAAAFIGSADAAMGATCVAGTLWLPLTAQVLHIQKLANGDAWWEALVFEPTVAQATATLAIVASVLGLCMLVASIQLRKATPAS